MMDEKLVELAELDTQSGLQHFAGKQAMYEKYLGKFESSENYAYAVEAFEKRDYNNVLKEVHALKGIAGTLGMNRLFRVSQEIVDVIRSGNEEKAAEYYKEFREAYEISLQAAKSVQ